MVALVAVMPLDRIVHTQPGVIFLSLAAGCVLVGLMVGVGRLFFR
jgi:hypothetical protein